MLLDDALAGLELVRRFEGPIVDVGSGGGTPGIPLAAELPEREVTLLEAERRKTEFLERWTEELSNLRVVWGRAEEQPNEAFRRRGREGACATAGRGRVVPAARRRRRRGRALGRPVGRRSRRRARLRGGSPASWRSLRPASWSSARRARRRPASRADPASPRSGRSPRAGMARRCAAACR